MLMLDVDGVLTTGELAYTGGDADRKVFFVQDGGAIKLWQNSGGLVAVLSGRESEAVTRRVKELGIPFVVQGLADKLPAYEGLCREAGVVDAEVAFMGDDLLDVGPMQRCGYAIAPANALPVVKRAARFVTRRAGGQGAVVEAVERLLRHNGAWTSAMRSFDVHG